jgi:hypothetical protein
MRLGDSFPPKVREELAHQNLKIGAILRFFNNETTPPKIKIVIVVGFDGEKVLLAYVFINTKMPPNQYLNLHLHLPAQDKDYLEHDSYVDCRKIYTNDINEIKEKMIADSDIHRGNLDTADLQAVVEKIKASRTISLDDKEKFGFV